MFRIFRLPSARLAQGITLALALALPRPAAAQADPWILTLEDAIDLARRNNPQFLQSVNDRDLATWDVRTARANWLPRASVSGGLAWQGQGDFQLGGPVTASDFGFGNRPSIYSSNYNASLTWNFSGETLFRSRQAGAARGAVESRIQDAEQQLVVAVTDAYLTVLAQEERAVQAEQQLERARFNLRLARAQADVGTATLLDVRQAEVQVGRAEVAGVQTEAAVVQSRVRFMQQLGLNPTQAVSLTTTFEVVEPRFTEEELFAEAIAANPRLRAATQSLQAAVADERVARSAYFPTLSLSASIGGFTQQLADDNFVLNQAQGRVAQQVASCQTTNTIYARLTTPLPPLDCSGFVFTDADRQAVLAQNNVFPFDFTRQPARVGLNISIPLFQGLTRQRNLEAAQVARDDLQLDLRSQELALRADIAADLAQLRAAYLSAQIEDRNVELADEQLRLARERYRIGQIPFVDLVEAETVKAQADLDRLVAVYDYHRALAQLEGAVGRPLADSR